MTPDEMEELAQRMSDCANGVNLVDTLGALGMVITQVIMQLPPEERMPACVSWIAMFAQNMAREYNRSKAN